MSTEDGISSLSGRRSPFSSVLRVFSDSVTNTVKVST